MWHRPYVAASPTSRSRSSGARKGASKTANEPRRKLAGGGDRRESCDVHTRQVLPICGSAGATYGPASPAARVPMRLWTAAAVCDTANERRDSTGRRGRPGDHAGLRPYVASGRQTVWPRAVRLRSRAEGRIPEHGTAEVKADGAEQSRAGQREKQRQKRAEPSREEQKWESRCEQRAERRAERM